MLFVTAGTFQKQQDKMYKSVLIIFLYVDSKTLLIVSRSSKNTI